MPTQAENRQERAAVRDLMHGNVAGAIAHEVAAANLDSERRVRIHKHDHTMCTHMINILGGYLVSSLLLRMQAVHRMRRGPRWGGGGGGWGAPPGWGMARGPTVIVAQQPMRTSFCAVLLCALRRCPSSTL